MEDKVALCFCFLSFVLWWSLCLKNCVISPLQESVSYESLSYESEEAKYDFEWAVNDASTGNDFGQQEGRDGSNTQGSYYVALPDGRVQKVDYRVDGGSGFIADVNYDGEARYDSFSYESASSESASHEFRYFGSNSDESK